MISSPNQAYIDDSGKGQPPVFVLAGFVASTERWAIFRDKWQAALNGPHKHGPLTYFKMKDAAHLRGQFYKWIAEDRDAFLLRLISIIESCLTLGIAAVISYDDYRKIFKGKVSKQADSPYMLAFYGIMQTIMRVQRQIGTEEPVDFIFDEQGKEIGRALAAWKYFVEASPAGTGMMHGNPPISSDDKTTLPLQAADLLAWRTRREIVDLSTGGDDAERLLPLESIRIFATDWDKATLLKLMCGLKSLRRATGRKFPYETSKKGGA